MNITQLRIDIKNENGISDELYKQICELITSHGNEVMDDGHAPYTEDMTEQYKEMGVI